MQIRSALRSAVRPALHGVFGHTAFPSGAILHFDANTDPYTEQTGGVHTFNHNVLGPQFQRNADGSYANVGAKPAVCVLDGKKWLRSCGAITNLFGGDTSQARSVSLTNGTVYTLHVFGAGTVSCSYGTATVEAPLKITATATGSVTFTPTGAMYWMLTATAYPVPYVPPGVTQPASNATATNGMWFANPDDLALWDLLYGIPTGVELVTNGKFDANTSGWATIGLATLTWNAGQLVVASDASGFRGAKQLVTVVAGKRYLVTGQKTGGTATAGKLRITDGTTELARLSYTTTAAANYSTVVVSTTTTLSLELYTDTANATSIWDNISVQLIEPQASTIGIRTRLDFASTDIPNSSVLNILTPDDVAGRFLTIQKGAGGALTAVLNDGTNSASVTLAAWARGAVLHFYPQVKTGATQMRIGYKTAAATSITWGTAATYAGTFGPDATLDRMMIGFNNAYPFCVGKLTVVPGEVADAEILGWWL